MRCQSLIVRVSGLNEAEHFAGRPAESNPQFYQVAVSTIASHPHKCLRMGFRPKPIVDVVICF